MYQGGFERNFPNLKPGATTFQGTDGSEHSVLDVPSKVDGVRFGYMEKAGKKFAVVRAQLGKDDVVLEHELLIDPGRHLGFGNRLSPEPTMIEDEFAATILEDAMVANTEQRRALTQMRLKFSVTGHGKAQKK
jgi:hypothetical protein